MTIETKPDNLGSFIDQWPLKVWPVKGLAYNRFNPDHKSYRHAMEEILSGVKTVKIDGMFTQEAHILYGTVFLKLDKKTWKIEKVRTQ